MRLFDKFIPEVEKVSLYELLAENGMSAVKSKETFAIFDPCMARNFSEMEKAVWTLAMAGNVAVKELPDRNHCCGFGGHMRAANPDLFNTIIDRRISVDEAPYLVYCANCAWTFALADKTHVHILDLVFETEDAAGTDESLQKQRDNAIRVKAALIDVYESGAFKPVARPWNALRLKFPASVVADMNLRLILADDVKEAIYESERANEVFVMPGGAPNGDELRQGRLIRDVVTTWVQYVKYVKRETEDDYDYTIVDVWNHRMRFSDIVD